jgi:hypothetical protein
MLAWVAYDRRRRVFTAELKSGMRYRYDGVSPVDAKSRPTPLVRSSTDPSEARTAGSSSRSELAAAEGAVQKQTSPTKPRGQAA